jgi:gluconate:H+ symporter, GntP family
LFVLGTASALGGMLTTIIPLQDHWPKGLGNIGTAVVLFCGASLFKLLQGSSMATFAAVSSVAGPIILSSGLSPTAAVFAICLGTLVAIAPNDSFYWLVRTDAIAESGEGKALKLLTATSVVQGLSGLCILLLAVSGGYI